ncbi:MAG TPA: dihydrodipicolinate synthase family protein [Candidatus Limnocylindria bacterium]|nr:dihydrodipicolinate synthase family protein [Candidatus Limnocylindria bacterium]
MKTLFGVTTAMTTPFTKRGSLDTEALEQQTDFLVDKGVHALYPCGTTGEMYLMTARERMLAAQTVVNRAGGRVSVFVHCGAMHMDEAVRLARHAADIGADGIGVVTPSYFGVPDDAIVEYYRKVCGKVPRDFPVYAYAIPQLAKNDITAECMRRIADACPNVVGIKYSYPDLKRFIEYLALGRGLSVVFGADDLFLPALVMGGAGSVSGCSSCVPEPFVNVYRYFKAGDMEKAREEQMRCFRLVRVLKGGSDLAVFKAVQAMRGVRGGYTKAPLPGLSDAEHGRLREELAEYLGA